MKRSGEATSTMRGGDLEFDMDRELTRTEVDNMLGITVLEFGASWCPICQGARPMIDRVLAQHTAARLVWVEDGKGKPLGRSFRIKLWPTLVFLKDGHEVTRLVRPGEPEQLEQAFQQLAAI